MSSWRERLDLLACGELRHTPFERVGAARRRNRRRAFHRDVAAFGDARQRRGVDRHLDGVTAHGRRRVAGQHQGLLDRVAHVRPARCDDIDLDAASAALVVVEGDRPRHAAADVGLPGASGGATERDEEKVATADRPFHDDLRRRIPAESADAGDRNRHMPSVRSGS